MKLGRYGFVTIFMFLIFIFIKFIKNLYDISLDYSLSDYFDEELIMFKNDISKSTGAMALSFLAQN